MKKDVVKVAFVCVHNSCRSQIAEALGKRLACDVFESYSAGTETKPQINQDAVRLMKQKYQIDMEKRSTQTFIRYSTSGCCDYNGMQCRLSKPSMQIQKIGDWKILQGKSDEEFAYTIRANSYKNYRIIQKNTGIYIRIR